IDTFFQSLAEDQGNKAIAVILSGTGTDGSKGIQAIQHTGGMVLVQDPISAKFDGMPNSAIASGFADYILAPELMPEEILNYIKERPVRLTSDGKPDETHLPEVLKLIEKSCLYDFTNYKTPTILRRIGRRMTQLGYRKFTDYLNLLRDSSEECKLLGKEFLIGVTKFFRDKAAFEILRDEVLFDIVQNKKDGEIIKIWVAACSTGEEAYTMAILLNELLQAVDKDIEIKIFATDIDLDAIEFASRGVYPVQSVAEMEDHLFRKYFIHQDGNVAISPALRKQIVFARHNILKDPPFIKNDLVTCRNMLIYMNNILQRKVFSTLQFSLNTGGFLFLGPSEVPTSIRDGFEELNGKWKIYRKVSNGNQYNPERFPSTQAYKAQRDVRFAAGKENAVGRELADDFKSLLTEEYGFAAVYIDKNFDVREAVGDYKKFLSLPSKSINLQLLKMVSPEVSVVLNTALRKVAKEGVKVSLHNVRLRGDEAGRGVNVFVKPATREGYYLVGFSESQEVQAKTSQELPQQPYSENSAYIAELEDELKETRGNLQMAIESLETANEELQSSNEELLSANEELQSSNEELQSLNEELHTLNTEHQLRIKELVELNDDLNNYFRSTEIAQVFVDRNLRIRKFNPAAVAMINLIEEDIGRPIEHISTNIRESNLFAYILEVMKSGREIDREATLSDGRVTLMRILPYLRQDQSTDGVVVSFIDISGMKQRDNLLKGVFNASPNAILSFSPVMAGERIESFTLLKGNYAADAIIGKEEKEYSGKNIQDIFPELVQRLSLDELAAVIAQNKPLQKEILLPVKQKGEEWFLAIAAKMEEGLAMSLTNIHEKKIAEEKFRRNYHELLKTKDSYRRLNIELEEKVKERTVELTESEERFRLIANTTSDAIWDWDLVNNKVWWSDSFYKRFGFSDEEQAGNSSFWLTRVHPEDKEAVSQSLQAAINQGAKDWTARFRLQMVDGSYAMILDKGTVLADSSGTPYRMVGAMIDITDAERASQLLQQKNNELQTLFEE
ncbi:MAG TPA: CheR family methyltransferase, partial [Flavisolibacter sp.]|nr:CheR family methyltransferase [Flavisolibacter sp.]